MTSVTRFLNRHGSRLFLGVVVVMLLYLAVMLYGVGETMLGAGTLFIALAAFYTYTQTRSEALRYLFPGVFAALVFVVFPMVFTVSIGFTNYSSQHLLDHDRARDYLLSERMVDAEAPTYSFRLFGRDGPTRIEISHKGEAPNRWLSPPVDLSATPTEPVALAVAESALDGTPEPLRTVIAQQKALRALTLTLPSGEALRMSTLRTFAPVKKRYTLLADGALRDNQDQSLVTPDFTTGYFVTASGEELQPGFKVGVGLAHYVRIFTDPKFQEPFLRIFVWTVMFSALTVVFATALGLLLAVLLNWEGLRGRQVYRIALFLPYAVPGFISILIFKGLFNQNLGEINMLLDAAFGVRPAWFSDPFLAKTMLLIVNTWLGFPFMMIVCMGLIKSIPGDLYEASAVAGAGPWTNFREITMPLILKPLTPLLISSFAFNFNNFVLITLLTSGRPDYTDTLVPAGTTDILVSYTFRIAFQDSGQQFGLASAISTVIFLIVAAITLVQMRYTRLAQAGNAR